MATTNPAEAARRFDKRIREQLPFEMCDYAERTAAAGPVALDNPRIRDLIDWFCDKYLPSSGLKPRNIQKYDQVLRDYQLWARRNHIGRVQQVTYAGVLEFLEWLSGLSPTKRAKRPRAVKTRDDIKAILRGMFRTCVDVGLLTASHIARWETRTIRSPDRPTFALTRDELVRVLEIIHDQAPYIEPVIRWMVLTGCGISDAVDLRWSQVHDTHVRRRHIKTEIIAYSLCDAARAILDAAKAAEPGPNNEVFTNARGNVLTTNSVYRSFVRALQRSGFTVTRDGQALGRRSQDPPAYLWHPYGHLGCPPGLLQRQMGHRRLETTMRYYHPDPDAGLAFAQKLADTLLK